MTDVLIVKLRPLILGRPYSNWHLQSSFVVRKAGFEPAVSCIQGKRNGQTFLLPDIKLCYSYYIVKIVVYLEGFEPSTLSPQMRCASQTALQVDILLKIGQRGDNRNLSTWPQTMYAAFTSHSDIKFVVAYRRFELLSPD